MTFKQWVRSETGMAWEALKSSGTTQKQLYRLYDDYDFYCVEKNVNPVWDFKK